MLCIFLTNSACVCLSIFLSPSPNNSGQMSAARWWRWHQRHRAALARRTKAEGYREHDHEREPLEQPLHHGQPVTHGGRPSQPPSADEPAGRKHDPPAVHQRNQWGSRWRRRWRGRRHGRWQYGRDWWTACQCRRRWYTAPDAAPLAHPPVQCARDRVSHCEKDPHVAHRQGIDGLSGATTRGTAPATAHHHHHQRN